MEYLIDITGNRVLIEVPNFYARKSLIGYHWSNPHTQLQSIDRFIQTAALSAEQSRSVACYRAALCSIVDFQDEIYVMDVSEGTDLGCISYSPALFELKYPLAYYYAQNPTQELSNLEQHIKNLAALALVAHKDNIDRYITIIRDSDSPQEAAHKLTQCFDLSIEAALFAVDCPLRSLSYDFSQSIAQLSAFAHHLKQ